MFRSSWKLSLTMGVVVLGTLLVTTSSASGAAPEPDATPAAEQTAAAVHIPTAAEAAKSFKFMSMEQYKAKVGATKAAAGLARAAAIAEATNKAQADAEANPKKALTSSAREQTAAAKAAAAVVCSAHPGNWYDVVHGLYLKDLSGNIIPIRVGKSDFQWQGGDSGANYNHASVDHNLCNLNAFDILFSYSHRGKEYKNIADRYEYDGVVVDDELDVEATLTAAASAATHGFGDNTPDGRPFGMVTAFCNGYTNCPAWVNSVHGPLG